MSEVRKIRIKKKIPVSTAYPSLVVPNCLKCARMQGREITFCPSGKKFCQGKVCVLERPVAEALYEGQKLSESKIHFGSVAVNGEMIPGTFRWNKQDLEKRVVFGEKNVYGITFVPEKPVVINRKRALSISCGNLKVQVYQKNYDKAYAFVWQSQDRAPKSGLKKGNGIQKEYPNLLDSIAIGEIYKKYNIAYSPETAKKAARLTAGYLFRMPKGRRSLSIENHFQIMMGGMIYQADSWRFLSETVENEAERQENIEENERIRKAKAILHSLVGDHPGDGYWRMDKETRYLTEQELAAIEDSNVREKCAKAIGTLRDTYGIPDGSSGCARTGEILTAFFKELAAIGAEVDFATCDIEHVGSDSWMISKRGRIRYGLDVETQECGYAKDCKCSKESIGGYIACQCSECGKSPFNRKCTGNCKDLKGGKCSENCICLANRKWIHLWDSIKEVPEVWQQFEKRGFWSEGKEPDIRHIDTIRASAAGQYGNEQGDMKYGYLRRRNVNIFDAVMHSYTNGLFEKYVAGPLWKAFPEAKFSLYGHGEGAGYVNYAVRNETYLGGTTTVGEKIYSTPTMYGVDYSIGDKRYALDDRRNYIPYRTAFSTVQADINEFRKYLFSSDKKPISYVCSHYFWPGLRYGTGTASEQNREEQEIQSFGNRAENLKIDRYYNEMMYHVWMSAPMAVYGYLNYGDIDDYRHTVEAHDTKTVFQELSETDYYQHAFRRFQEVLTEINQVLPCPTDRHLNTQFANELHPYLISGVKCGNKNVWRLTFDMFEDGEYLRNLLPCMKKEGGGCEFSFRGYKIEFEEVCAGKVKQTYHGFWIITPDHVVPKITPAEISIGSAPSFRWDFTKENNSEYFKENFEDGISASELKKKNQLEADLKNRKNQLQNLQAYPDLDEETLKQEIEKLEKELDPEIWDKKVRLNFKDLHNHTVFGEAARHLAARTTLCFKKEYFDRLDEKADYITILGIQKGNLVKAGDLKKRLEKLGCFTGNREAVCIFEAELDVEKLVDAVKEETYEYGTKLYLRSVNGMAVPEAEQLLAEKKDQGILKYNEAPEVKMHSRIPRIAQTVSIIKPRLDSVVYRDFSLCQRGMNIKFEVFRKSDGVNISRVNPGIWGLEKTGTKAADKLIGKLSWLNAAQNSNEYRVVYEQLDSDGTVTARNTVISRQIKKNEEGYQMAELPVTRPDTAAIRTKVLRMPKKLLEKPLQILQHKPVKQTKAVRPLQIIGKRETVETVTIPIG